MKTLLFKRFLKKMIQEELLEWEKLQKRLDINKNDSKIEYKELASLKDEDDNDEEYSGMFKDMSSTDKASFDKYGGYFSSRSLGYILSDIKDDFTQPGFLGYGAFQTEQYKKEIVGYIYGYDFIKEDNFDGIEYVDVENIKFYDKSFEAKYDKYGNVEDFYDGELGNKKIFYVSNFASKIPIVTAGLLYHLVQIIKSNGYDFIAFDALSDSKKLFLNDDLSEKTSRLNKLNVKLVIVVTDPDDDSSVLGLVKIN